MTAVVDPGAGADARPDIRIAIRNVTKTFVRRSGEQVSAVDDVTLNVEDGEFLVLLGPSGCGKTTLLRAIAGLESLDGGRIEVQGLPVVDTDRRLHVPPERRPVSMMFQSYALWPHMSVFDNIAYPLAARKVDRGAIRERVHEVMDAVGIGELATQYPGQISGGQQQRVALARALVPGDAVVLFDEPLSNVDARVREQLRAEILRLHRTLDFTAVYVTHDQDEALALATRIAVLRKGKVAQAAPPREVYEQPADAYVARFMGATDELPGRVRAQEPDGRCQVETPLGMMRGFVCAALPAGDSVTVFTRPEAWRFAEHRPEVDNVWRASLDHALFQGFYVDQFVQVGEELVRVRSLPADAAETGAAGWLSIDADDVLVLPGDQPSGGPDAATVTDRPAGTASAVVAAP